MKKEALSIVAVFAAALLLTEVFFPASAHAGYLDSGAGSSLVQAVVAVAAGAARAWDSFCRAIGIRK